MRSKWTILASVVLAVSMISTSAWAAPNSGKNHEPTEMEKADQHGKDKDVTVEADDDADGTVTSVTYDTYGKGHRGYRGLQNAYEHVKDKPAGKIIAGLLAGKYGIDVNATTQALNDAADQIAAEGDLETAAEVQKEAVKADIHNLAQYKKLSKLYEKLGKKGVKAYVNGEQPTFEVPPFIKDDSTLVQFRAICEALKAEVTWNPDERSVTVKKDGVEVKLFIGKTTAFVNGKEVTLDVAGEIYQGSTMVPVRFISESLKAKVDWESETQSVVITDGQQ